MDSARHAGQQRMQADLHGQLEALGARGHRSLVSGVIAGGVSAAAGWTAGDAQEPDEWSMFELGSVTKTFTGALLAEMTIRGEVSLDDPLSRHLPTASGMWDHREPTLLELATHRSGLPNAPKGMSGRELTYSLGWSDRNPWSGVGPGDYEDMVKREALRSRPGERVRYSSMAVGLLGDALAARAQKTYEALLTERILEPLGMTSTAVSVPKQRAAQLLDGHARNGKPRPPIEDVMAPAGSLRSTTHDMLQFLAACLEPPRRPPGPALALSYKPVVRLNRQLHIGLCWFISGLAHRPKTVWHAGGTWGFRCFAAFAPERGTAAVVASNTARAVDRLGLQLVEAAGARAVSEPGSNF